MSQLPSTEWQSDLQRDRAAAADLSLSNLDVFPREPRVRGPAARRVRVAERLRSKPPPIERVPVLAPGLRPRVQVPWPAERSSLPRPELRPVPQELGRPSRFAESVDPVPAMVRSWLGARQVQLRLAPQARRPRQ